MTRAEAARVRGAAVRALSIELARAAIARAQARAHAWTCLSRAVRAWVTGGDRC